MVRVLSLAVSFPRMSYAAGVITPCSGHWGRHPLGLGPEHIDLNMGDLGSRYPLHEEWGWLLHCQI